MLSLLKKSSIGLDISDSTIELVELEKTSNSFTIISLGRLHLSPGIVERGRILDFERLSIALKKVAASAKPKPISFKDEVVFGLPESIVYTHVVHLTSAVQDKFEKFKKKQQDQYIKKQALKLIPLEESEMILTYDVRKRDKKISFLLNAISQKDLHTWKSFFDKLNIKTVYDIEAFGIARALYKNSVQDGVCIADIGEVTTNLMIFDELGLHNVYKIQLAGAHISKSIEKKLGIGLEEAEKKKKKVDIGESAEETTIVINQKLEQISVEIKKFISYYRRNTQKNVNEVVLVGGTSRLKGIDHFFEESLGIPVTIGKSWLADTALKSSLQTYLYIEALGLALRKLDNQWDSSRPLFEIGQEFEKQKIEKVKKQEKAKKPVEQKTSDYSKLKKQKILLLVILLVGIVVIIIAFGYRRNQREKQAAEFNTLRTEITVEQVSEIEQVGNNSSEIIYVLEEKESNFFEDDAEEIQQVTISETPTGWLNVRSGPGTNFSVVKQVFPGETYELIERQGLWYNILISTGLNAWVYSDYASLVGEAENN